ncbi:MAG: hypothetical protein ABIK43_01855 [candidate division WOR-3 bacterium]
MNRAREAWRQQIAQHGNEAFQILLRRALPGTLIQVVAEEALSYYRQYPQALNEHVVHSLKEVLDPVQVRELEKLCPPTHVTDLPGSLEEIVEWFRHSYLPYRLWEVEHGDEFARERIHKVAWDFAIWYLRYYPGALARGDNALAIYRVQRLYSDLEPGEVFLWMLLDGLHYVDASRLVNTLRKEPRITILSDKIVLSTLPTVTEFCKEALLRGAPPVDTKSPPVFRDVTEIANNRDPAEYMRKARPGDVFLWRLIEPDATYHRDGDRSVILSWVRDRIDALAQQLVRSMLAVPDELRLRVLITTDHGRLLGSSNRCHAVPQGGQAHGRAAWGEIEPRDFPLEGFVIDQENRQAFLSKIRFQLPEHCVVALDSDAFLTQDGKAGREEFAHGGFFPEEVLLPWVEVARDVAAPHVQCVLRGRNQAEQRGTARLEIVNAGHVPLRMSELRMTVRADTVSVPLSLDEVLPSSSRAVEVMLPRWPTERNLKQMQATLVLVTPHGRKFEYDVAIKIQVTEMYQPSLELEDFLQ